MPASRHLLRILIAISILSPLFGVSAQTPQDTPINTLKVDAKLVAVSAVARDETGKPVPTLTREALTLKQDGKPQQITYFSRGADLPLTLALMVDTSGSQLGYIGDEIRASNVFFPALMTRPTDRALLIQFDAQIRQLADLTSSLPTLEKGLRKLDEKNNDHAGGTLLYDAICGVAQLDLGNQLGRRAMVILTDGQDEGSSAKLNTAIAEAQRADIMIYSVYYSNGGGNKSVLTRLSKATGGRVFIVTPTTTLAQIYNEINDDLRMVYEIGYRPPDSPPNKFHKIELKATTQHLTIQAREGYFSK